MRPQFPLFVIAVALIAPSTAYLPDTLTVTSLDVGQGDSILVQAPDGRAMLVDAGESWAAPDISAALAGEGIGRLDYIVATHEHADHIGGMVGVLSSVTAGAFVSNGVLVSTQTEGIPRKFLFARSIPSDRAIAGQTMGLDPTNVTVTIMNPPVAPGTDQNEASVVLRLVFGDQSFLLAGDAGTTAQGRVLASGRPRASRILTAGHHGGSRTNTTG